MATLEGSVTPVTQTTEEVSPESPTLENRILNTKHNKKPLSHQSNKEQKCNLNTKYFSRCYLVPSCFLNMYDNYECFSFHSTTGESILNVFNESLTNNNFTT